jgi:hypothetical protein
MAAILFGLTAPLTAQDAAFLTSTEQFAKKKVSYITLKSGEELEGNIKKFDRKRGMTKAITIETTDGKTREIDAGRIKHAYLFPSAYSRIGSFFDDLDVQRWGKDLNEDLFKNGYVYMETVLVQTGKKKKENLLLQLLNPHFAEGIRIYDDPFGSESRSFGVGIVKVAGGNANSYYALKPGDRMATYLHKGMYKKQFDDLFEGCSAVTKGSKAKWNELADQVQRYASECAEAR